MTFVIRNAQNEVVIDFRYRCMQIVAEGSFQVTNSPWQIFTINYPQRPLYEVCIQVFQNVQYLFSYPGSTSASVATNLPVGAVLNWKVVSVAQDGLETGNSGLIVRDASGSTVFSSARKSAQFVAYVPGTGMPPTAQQPDYSNGAGWATQSGQGELDWVRVRHWWNPVPFGTFFSIRRTGSYPRDGQNHNFYPFRRTTTTEFDYTRVVLNESFLTAMNIPPFVPIGGTFGDGDNGAIVVA